jgi:hypothetical protein
MTGVIWGGEVLGPEISSFVDRFTDILHAVEGLYILIVVLDSEKLDGNPIVFLELNFCVGVILSEFGLIGGLQRFENLWEIRITVGGGRVNAGLCVADNNFHGIVGCQLAGTPNPPPIQ